MKKGGFTLLELLIAVSIITLLGAASLVSFINSRRIRELDSSGQNVLSILRLAQSRALAGEENDVWGVRLELARFILFRGPAFAGSPSAEIHQLPAAIEIANIALAGGGQEIIFQKITGRTEQSGTFELRVTDDAAKIFSVTVDSSGKVYRSGAASPPSGNRITDTRHRQFNLGWSIQDSLTLTLTFSDPPNPDTISSLTMLPPPPRSTFDWSGTIAVGGENQTLRIHASSITVSGAILQVDRDCRYNNKKMEITIDIRDIATYEADCQTVIVGAFGGTMTEP